MRGVALAIMLVAVARAEEARPRPFRLEELKTPPGFEVSVYARIAGGPRHMAFGPNGVLYVAARSSGAVVAVPKQDQTVTVLRGLNGPHSLVFRDSALYVSVNDAVLRFRDAVSDDLVIRSQPERIASLPTGAGHSTRTLGFGPDSRIYVTAGSSCNFCREADTRRAAMMRFEADGSGQQIYATGLRNTVGFAWHPVTADLWAVDNGGDNLGDDEPPEEINIIQQGGDYGWPDCIGQRRGVQWGTGARPERCTDTVAPELEMQAHSAPLGISFYTGVQFPASFQNDAFITFHGSWNRAEPIGYKVVRVRASSGRAAGIEDFLWGFLDPATGTRSGRPVLAVTGPDGTLYVSDDATGNIYRVIYSGPRINGIRKAVNNIFELYGNNLVNDPAQFSIFANGLLSETLYLGSNQVNFVLPDSLSGDVTISVQNEKASDSAVIRVE